MLTTVLSGQPNHCHYNLSECHRLGQPNALYISSFEILEGISFMASENAITQGRD